MFVKCALCGKGIRAGVGKSVCYKGPTAAIIHPELGKRSCFAIIVITDEGRLQIGAQINGKAAAVVSIRQSAGVDAGIGPVQEFSEQSLDVARRLTHQEPAERVIRQCIKNIAVAGELRHQAAQRFGSGEISAGIEREGVIRAELHGAVQGKQDIGQGIAKILLGGQVIRFKNEQSLTRRAVVPDKIRCGLIKCNRVGEGAL